MSGQRELTLDGNRPRVSLTMIVKNEEAALFTLLRSIRDLVDEMIVVDTGSKDSTKDIAAQCGARVFDSAWCDSFAAARNEALRHATGEWILWLDADEYFDDANRDKLRLLLGSLDRQNAAFVMKQFSPAWQGGSVMLVDQVRLFRNLPAIRWDYRGCISRRGSGVHLLPVSAPSAGFVRSQSSTRPLPLVASVLSSGLKHAETLVPCGATSVSRTAPLTVSMR
jgi:glycosyltransferase involved in cell wall biosynthesis